MKEKIKIAVVGYGKVGNAICNIASHANDIELVGAFTRRATSSFTAASGVCIIPYEDIMKYAENVDCLLLAHGSKSDAPATAASLAARFNVIDCYDDHGNARAHLATVDKIAKASSATALLCTGWDPGLLSLARSYFSAFIPGAAVTTLWGPGMSLGHSEALRAIDGVFDAIEITEPKPSAKELALGGNALSVREGHKRICYVNAKKGSEAGIIESISRMEGYFRGYETEIHFVDKNALSAIYNEAHRGCVIASSREQSGAALASAELSVQTSSNPALTANVMLACVRPLVRLREENRYGAYTLLDVPPAYFLKDAISKL